MRHFIVGTAGHIDHGKSALVRALTGIDPDRLPEEKRRGITIELGFAHGRLSEEVGAAFVDVPGHEKFVRTMVAGAHGVDVVLLVVAADEGVMPQTREHADICQLLNLPRAVIALTKSDLLPGLDPEWAPLVEEDIRQLGPLFRTAPLVPVSALTGDGLEALRQALCAAAEGLPPRRDDESGFLPIDRVFTIHGHGTVVTGTLLSGALTVEDTVDVVVPAPRSARVLPDRRIRALQVHGKSVERAVAGQRVAVNLVADVAEIPRGSTLMRAGTGAIRQGSQLDAELEILAGALPIKNRTRLTIHLGTAQALATVDLLGHSEQAAGTRAAVQLRLDRALPALRDQRFVLRGFGGGPHGARTVAGGRLLLPDPSRRRAVDGPLIEALRGNASVASAALVRAAGAQGLDAAWISIVLPNGAGALRHEKGIVELDGRLFDREAFEPVTQKMAAIVREHGSVPREELRSRLGPGVHPAAFTQALSKLGPRFTCGESIALVAAPRDPLAEQIEGMLLKGRWAPPTAGELVTLTGRDRAGVAAALRLLAREGRSVRLTDELFVHAAAAAEFRQRALESLRAKGALTMLEFKEMVGSSRKFVVPLCEWLDREHVTLRVGEKRVLRGQGPA